MYSLSARPELECTNIWQKRAALKVELPVTKYSFWNSWDVIYYIWLGQCYLFVWFPCPDRPLWKLQNHNIVPTNQNSNENKKKRTSAVSSTTSVVSSAEIRIRRKLSRTLNVDIFLDIEVSESYNISIWVYRISEIRILALLCIPEKN